MPAELLAPIASSGAEQIQLTNLAANSTRSTAISPGDLLTTRLVSGLEGEDLEPQVVQVSPTGEVDLPLIGAVAVAGLEPSAASRAIAQAAIDRGVYTRPNVTVEIEERATYQVTVLGAVTEPGVHQLPTGACNVLAAIATAGGLTEEAGPEIEILRQNSETQLAQTTIAPDGIIQQVAYNAPEPAEPRVERIDLAQAQSGGNAKQQLGDRDVVMVRPRRARVIHVTGLVNKSDQFEMPFDQDVRVLDAIAMAGGTSSVVADKVFVVRQRGESTEPAVIEVSIAKAKQRGQDNLVLAPGDLVSVESTAATATLGAIETFFRVSLGVTSTAFRF